MNYLDADTTDPTECLDIMVRMMKAACDLHLATRYPGFAPYVIGYDKGRKYAKFWYDNGTQRFVSFFVDMETGDVWKADGWKKPTLNFSRGNIFTAMGRAQVVGNRSPDSLFCYYPSIG